MKEKIFRFLNDAREGLVLKLDKMPKAFMDSEDSVNSRFWLFFMVHYMGILGFSYQMYTLHTIGIVTQRREVDKLNVLLVTLILLGLYYLLYRVFIHPHISFHVVDRNQTKEETRRKIRLNYWIVGSGFFLFIFLQIFFRFYRDYIYVRFF